MPRENHKERAASMSCHEIYLLFQDFVLVITGEALSFVLEVDELQFLRILQSAHSVLCCRVTPLQKVDIRDISLIFRVK